VTDSKIDVRPVRCAEYDDPAAQCGACDAGMPNSGPEHIVAECLTCKRIHPTRDDQADPFRLETCRVLGHDVRPVKVSR
jgi:hypothetical protein